MIRVLLVDHSLGHPNGIRGLLDVSGTGDLMVACVTTQREILKGLRSQTYDVCILDSLVDNGLQLFAQVRSLNFTVPIVLVVCDSAGVAVEAMRNGVADCLIRDDLSVAEIERAVCAVAQRTRYSSLQSQRERRHLAFLYHASEIVYTHDLEGNFTSINRAGERLTGYAQSEILRMKIGEIVMPEYQAIVRSLIERALDAQTQVARKIGLLTKDGSALTVEINIHPIPYQGQTIEIQGVARKTSSLPGFEIGSWETMIDKTSHAANYGMFAMPDIAGHISLPIFNR